MCAIYCMHVFVEPAYVNSYLYIYICIIYIPMPSSQAEFRRLNRVAGVFYACGRFIGLRVFQGSDTLEASYLAIRIP